jgi:hypothetical protein
LLASPALIPAINRKKQIQPVKGKYSMEQVTNFVDTTQISIAKKMLALENQIKGGISWFFAIAGLSVINSFIYISGGSTTFVVGLGATQFIDGFISALVEDVGGEIGTFFRVVEFGLDFLFTGIFLAAGILGRKKIRWAVIVGMALYGCDGLLSIAFGDWLSAFFHVLALFGLWRGQKSIAELLLLEKGQSTGNLDLIQKLIVEKPPVDSATRHRNLVRFSLITIIPFLLLLILLITLLLLNTK